MPLIDYYANYDYIATVLCENKDKPYLECNGKCYLQSQIKKNDFNNSHNHNSIPLIDLKDYPVSPIKECSYKTGIKDITKSSIFTAENSVYQTVLTSLFKPPKFISYI